MNQIIEDYAEFRKLYEAQHAASVPVREVVIREYPEQLEYAVLLMFITSALMSGVHTVPTVRETIVVDGWAALWVEDLVSLASLVSVELAIFISAYMIVKEKAIGYATMLATFLVAMISNLYSVSKALEAGTSSGAWPSIVAIVLGIGAPLIALMSGKMFINMHRDRRISELRADAKYREAKIKFDEEVLSEWKKYDKASRRLSAPRPLDVSEVDMRTRTSGHATGQGYTKQMDAKDIVIKHLNENPGDFDLPVRPLADKLNVGKSTVSDAKKIWRTNGHGNNNSI